LNNGLVGDVVEVWKDSPHHEQIPFHVINIMEREKRIRENQILAKDLVSYLKIPFIHQFFKIAPNKRLASRRG